MNDSAIPYLSGINQPKPTGRPRLTTWLDNILRRTLDIIIAFLGLILLFPLFAWIAMMIRRDSSGPIIYRGLRAGFRGRVFNILKFRTMFDCRESYQGSLVTAHDDPRITDLGRWLRDTKLNELPQLWNVLIGDMSLVGPRPEDPTIASRWPALLKEEIFSIRPGITSPATILFRDEETRLQSSSVMDDYLRTIMPSKLRLDTLYINNRSIFTDLDVIFWTLVVLLQPLRHSFIPETRLYNGPFSLFTSRYLNWFLGDSLTAFIAVGLSGFVWRLNGPLDIGWGPSIWLALGMALIFSMMNVVLGLNEVKWSRAPASDSLVLTLSVCIATTFLILVDRYLVHKILLPEPMLVVAGLLSLAGFISVRYRERLLMGLAQRWLSFRNGNSAVGERVLLVGAGHNSQMTNWFLGQSKLSRAFSVVGMVDDDPQKQGLKFDGYRVLGTTQDIPSLVSKHDIGLVFFTISNLTQADRQRILDICKETQTIVVMMPDIMKTLRDNFKFANTATHEVGDPQNHSSVNSEVHLDEMEELARMGDWERLRARLKEILQNN